MVGSCFHDVRFDRSYGVPSQRSTDLMCRSWENHALCALRWWVTSSGSSSGASTMCPPGRDVHRDRELGGACRGGAVAAVQLCKLAGEPRFTARGRRRVGHGQGGAGGARLAGWRRCSSRASAPRLSCTSIRPSERTITVIGERLGPRAEDPSPGMRSARSTRCTSPPATAGRRVPLAKPHPVATARGLETLTEAGIQLDALLGSSRGPGERTSPRPSIRLRFT